jgi:hypothetical protein
MTSSNVVAVARRLKDVSNTCIFVTQLEDVSTGTRTFHGWDNLETFIVWYNKIPESTRHVYEVIRTTRQKFKLDVDNPDPKNRDLVLSQLEDVIAAIQRVLPRASFLVFETSGPKTSFHVVECTYSFTDAMHVRAFIDTHRLHQICPSIDLCVYKSTQMFRLEGSSKRGAPLRVKRLLRADKDVTFYDGLVSHVVNCIPISTQTSHIHGAPIKQLPSNHAPKRSSRHSSHDVVDWDPTAFRIRGKRKDPHTLITCVSLTRIRPSYCPLCKRVHEHENAYLVVQPNGSFTWKCWRNS